MKYHQTPPKDKRPWCKGKCDRWYEAVVLNFLLWNEEEYQLHSGDMRKTIYNCPFCGKKLSR